MFLRMCFMSVLSFFFVTGAFAVPVNIPNMQYLTGAGVFNGDRHGDFRNDYVAILSDGSEWKIHPQDRDMFSNWNINDYVHIRVRTSFYWFKREHKFEMYNHTRNEAARVMIIQYPYYPLIIVNTQTYLTNSELVPITTKDENGNEYTDYYLVNTYEKVIYLNDGSAWIIKNDIDSFNQGNYVYLGVNDARDGMYFFVLTGTEREAAWTWASK